MKPRISLTLGDPSGIGPEIIAKLLADPDTFRAADVYLIGSKEEFLRGQRIAEVEVPFDEARSIDEADFGGGRPVLQDVASPSGGFDHGVVSAKAGRYCLETLGIAVDLVAAGATDAFCFAPLNKEAMHAGGIGFDDELHWLSDRLGVDGYVCEINVLGNLWTSRVTSHVALKDVSGLLSVERIVDAVVLIDGTIRDAGIAEPRIAVCGLNPHVGDGGAFGREEIDVIAPAIALARGQIAGVEGPFPADTVFIKARDGHYDAVVTMFHDQGQIAMKLMGFDRGVSVQGGLPVPVTTPAHGTAFDIVGQNRANVSPLRQAFELACVMSRRRMSSSVPAGGTCRSGSVAK